MRKCVICGENAGLLGTRTLEGKICRECVSYIPKALKLRDSSTDTLREFYEANKEKSKQFSTTASYAGVYIDGLHGMFCYTKNGKKDEPHEFKDIYRITELQEIALYCTDPKNVGTTRNIVVCDIKLKIRTKNIAAEYLVAHRKHCHHRVKNGHVEWDEPGELTMFRNMFNQMIDNEVNNIMKKLEAIQSLRATLTEWETSIEWAKGVLFLDKDVKLNNEIVRQRRNEMVKIFHPDRNSGFANTEIATMINDAYNMLSTEVQK